MKDALAGLRHRPKSVALASETPTRLPDWLTTRAAPLIALAAMGQKAEAAGQAALIIKRKPGVTASIWRQTPYHSDRTDMDALEAQLI